MIISSHKADTIFLLAVSYTKAKVINFATWDKLPNFYDPVHSCMCLFMITSWAQAEQHIHHLASSRLCRKDNTHSCELTLARGYVCVRVRVCVTDGVRSLCS